MEALKTIYSLVILLLLVGCSSTKRQKAAKCDYYANERVGDIRLKGYKCVNSELMGIPSHFPTDINYLAIENDNIENLTAKTFDRYPKLKYLKLARVGLENIEQNTFSSMKELVHLDLSDNKFLSSNFPFLPPNLETLVLDGMLDAFLYYIEDKMRPAAKTLKRLTMRRNHMWTIPAYVAELYSLTEVNVDDNDMSRIRFIEFASLCNLKSFSFTGNDFSDDDYDMCQCRFIWDWSKMKKIQMIDYACPSMTNFNENRCPRNRTVEFQDAERAFQQCQAVAQGVPFVYYIVLPAVLILAALVGYFAYRKFRALCCTSPKNDRMGKIHEEEVALDVAGAEGR